MGSTDEELRKIYDDIYRHHTDVWLDQGRSIDFQAYFADLVRRSDPQCVLEIGCGEGALLTALPGVRKFGIDPSIHALLRARNRGSAELALARCEQLPFPSEFFDVAVAVGVMEHFELADAALAEIRRVLTPGGRYIALIQTDLSRSERVALKLRQYVWPRPRPLALMRWVAKWLEKQFRHPIVQPLRKSYTVSSAKECLERNGLRVMQVITRKNQPSAPLSGAHVVILISGKEAH